MGKCVPPVLGLLVVMLAGCGDKFTDHSPHVDADTCPDCLNADAADDAHNKQHDQD